MDPCPVALRGIVPSLNTPFDDTGALDEASLRKLVEHIVASGCQGLLALAVAGEQASLRRDEKIRFLEIASDQNRNRVPMVVSVTSPDTDESIALARIAGAAGAFAISCQAPAGLTGRRLLEALKPVAGAGPEVLMVQDLDWSGGGLALADIVMLFENLPAFKCLKIETVPAGPKYSQVLAATGGALHVSGGWAVSQMPDALQRGVHAFIPTAMEAVYVTLYKRYQAADRDGARDLFHRLLPVLAFSNQHIDISILFFKALRQAEGLFATAACRAPARALDAVQQKECEQAISLALALQAECVAASD